MDKDADTNVIESTNKIRSNEFTDIAEKIQNVDVPLFLTDGIMKIKRDPYNIPYQIQKRYDWDFDEDIEVNIIG